MILMRGPVSGGLGKLPYHPKVSCDAFTSRKGGLRCDSIPNNTSTIAASIVSVRCRPPSLGLWEGSLSARVRAAMVCTKEDSAHHEDTASQSLAGGEVATRGQYGRAFQRPLVELTLIPGASVARIALDHGINANI